MFSGQCYAEIEVHFVMFMLPTRKTESVEIYFCVMSCTDLNFACLHVPGDEDGDDPYSCRVWLYSLCEEGWSSTGAWLCHRQAAAG